MRLRAFALVPALASAISAAGAQEQRGEFRAFTALNASELGALSPLMTPSMTQRKLNGAQYSLRYGVRDSMDIVSSSVAATVLLEIGMAASVYGTVGVRNVACEAGCEPQALAGIGGDMRLYQLGDVINRGSALTVAISGTAGYADLTHDNAWVFGVGAPIAVSFATGGKEGLRVVPYFRPLFGVGQTDAPCLVDNDCDRSGTRWVLGGGVGVWNPMSNFSASIGISQVVFHNSHPLYGVNVTYGGRR
ncbi:MAG TPA: hypothetical protein VFT29_09495 [Gemmatimonadaceae bacterium]|nr:hypothetical protein [Gemmatimonadaceae bacterium]